MNRRYVAVAVGGALVGIILTNAWLVARALLKAPEPATTVLTRGKSPVRADYGLDGFCPVTLVERSRWQAGATKFQATHGGVTFLFADEASRQAFNEAPERFAPVAQGHDVVALRDEGQAIRGARKHGLVSDGRIYLFASEENLTRFCDAPSKYQPVDAGVAQASFEE